MGLSRITLLIIIILLEWAIIPSFAFAHGDVMLVYSLIIATVLHPIFGGILLLYIKYKRVQVFLIYVCNVCVSWMWYLERCQREYVGLYLGFVLCPIVTFCLLVSVFKK